MIVEMAIAAILKDADIEGVSIARQSVLTCPECVRVGHAAYKSEERFTEGECGACEVVVLICRDTDMKAKSVADACESAIKQAMWERYADMGRERICSMDAARPKFKERDSSGRYVYQVAVSVTVDRSA